MTDATRKTLEGLAQGRIDTALRQGIATAPFLRAQAAGRLTDGVTAERAAARFAFVLVDEAQDCDALDLQIVTSLRDAGCRCIVVADPEQGIFGFRRADPMALGALGHAEFPLTGNFRSTASICAASATLRASDLPPETPMGEQREDRAVALLAYDGPLDIRIGESFCRLLRQHRIAAADAVVVAHQEVVAQRAVEFTAVRGSNRQGAVVARAVAPTASTEDRDAAVELIVEILTASLGNIARTMATSRWCRTTARQVLGMAASADPTRGPCKRIRDALASVRPLDAMPLVEAPHKRFRTKDQKAAKNVGASTSAPCVPCSTVHGVKGREYDAVLVVIPANSRLPGLIDAWRRRVSADEGRAVIYVAATRARHVLAVAVPCTAAAEVALLLRRHGARVEELDCQPVSVDAPRD